jgi:hypothetical protein
MTSLPARIDPELLAWAGQLSPEDRLRQANAAFRLYHALHHPFARPLCAGFDSFEERREFERREGLPC